MFMSGLPEHTWQLDMGNLIPEEALRKAEAIEALCQSPFAGDRIKGSELLFACSLRSEENIRAKIFASVPYLLGQELYGQVDPDDPRFAALPYEKDTDIPAHLEGFTVVEFVPPDGMIPTQEIIQKNTIQALGNLGADGTTQEGSDALAVLGILSTDSLHEGDARIVVGYLGRSTSHHDVALEALDILQGVLTHDEQRAKELNNNQLAEKVHYALAAVHAIRSRDSDAITQKAQEILEWAVPVFSDQFRMHEHVQRAARMIITGIMSYGYNPKS